MVDQKQVEESPHSRLLDDAAYFVQHGEMAPGRGLLTPRMLVDALRLLVIQYQTAARVQQEVHAKNQKNALVLNAPLTAPFITYVLGLYRAGLINLSGSAAPIIQAYNEAQAEAVENGLELDEKALVQAVLGRFQEDVAVVAAPPPSRRSRAEVMEAARAPVTRPPDTPPSEPHVVSEPVDLTAHELEAWGNGKRASFFTNEDELIKMRRTLAWLVRQALLKGTR